VANRIAWPHAYENDALIKWRANILAAMFIAGVFAGVFAYAAAAVLIVKKNAWDLAIVDTLGIVLCLVFIFVHHVRYEIRAGTSLFMLYIIGMAIILSMGPLSGGPVWLFAFSVIAGILTGIRGAFAAILINVVSIAVIGWLMSTGRWGQTFVFFSSTQAMIAAGVNFVFLNTLTAVGVATLVQGLSEMFQDRQVAQRKLLENQKMALVGQVAGKMAHDFNNILGVVMGTAELARLDCPHEPTRKSLEMIFDQTVRGKNLTQNLVAFAKDQEPKQEYFKVHEKIDLVLDLLKKDLDGIDVSTEYARDLPPLLADPGMIEHALVNLVQNAVHALSLIPSPRLVIRVRREKSWMIMEIKDNGCGIPAVVMERVFEPSFTLKGSKDIQGVYRSGIKGTGYGMANVKRYVQQHRGTISLHSEPHKGTVVCIRLPIVNKELTPEEIADTGIDRFVIGKQILVVEDEPAISDIQYRILTQAPCRHVVDIAENGRAALDFLSKKFYDLISLDYVLPGGQSGMDIYRHIRQHHKTVPVVFISGNIQFLESIQALQKKDPHLDYLSKPCMNKEYIRSINQLLEKK
jgi:signal transduction histidine kinase/ActR/RegA family two-component response regulator